MATINGTANNDILRGSAFIDAAGNVSYDVADTINGLNGDDNLDGAGGNDVVNGGNGHDTVSGGYGDDRVYGGSGNDSVYGDFGSDVLIGGIGDDFVWMLSYENATFIDSNGNTPYLSYGGGDIGDGGAGNDMLVIWEGGTSSGHAGNGGDGRDSLQIRFIDTTDTAGAPQTIGYSVDLSRVWTGGVGTVGGSTVRGVERLIGISGLNGNDRIVIGADYITPINPVSGLPFDGPIVDGNGGDDYISGGGSIDYLNGGTGADTLLGEGGDDTLAGGSGNDLLCGGAGADQLSGNTSDDRLFGDDGADALFGEDGNDVLSGDGGIDRVYGGEGNDRLFGGADADQLYGSTGADYLDGGAGDDYAAGGSGDDVYIVDSAGDVVGEAPGEGLDEVRASVDFVLGANLEILRLTGSAAIGTGNTLDNALYAGTARATLYGLAGNDTLTGGNAADTIVGGAGRDVMKGGAGRDLFVFADGDTAGVTAATADRILDFVQGEDRISLRGIDADAILAGDQNFRFIDTAAFSGSTRELRYVQSGAITLVEGDTDGNGIADFALVLNGSVTLVNTDFVV